MRRPARAPQTPFTPFENFHVGLLKIHGELRQQASGILAGATRGAGRTAVATMIADFCENLEGHHRSEDVFFFPAFRAAGRLRSTDIAFLDARDDEHLAIVRLVGELKETGGRARGGNPVRAGGWRGSVQRLVTELTDIASPHFASEETVLTADCLAQMITARELVDVYRDMGMNWHRR